MGVLGGNLGLWMLRRLSPGEKHDSVPVQVERLPEQNKLDIFFGPRIWKDIINKTVLDFGCGYGKEAVLMAQGGARHVIGLDMRENVLESARKAAETAGVSEVCSFCQTTTALVDTITSFDAFEHFEDPLKILTMMSSLLKPQGVVWITFGPPWYHPNGGHLFSIFPWAHFVFTESALIRWRSEFKNDGATRFEEVEGGLNRMTIARFRKIISNSPFRIEWFRAMPIHRLRYLTNPITREFVTSSVQCKLILRKEKYFSDTRPEIKL
jgi:SAM-dependent methyltransferase